MRSASPRWLGIDFSGNTDCWRPGRARNVWIAEAVEHGGKLVLDCLVPVQSLGDKKRPFRELIARLRRRDFAAAAIDAPFSIPARYLPSSGRSELLNSIKTLDLHDHRPFPSGIQLVEAVSPDLLPRGRKEYRVTERSWGVNARSTLWAGPRSGAPFTAACLKLIAESGLDCWPWIASRSGLLVEAFPAAQLRTWELPFHSYSRNTPSHLANRRAIVAAVSKRIIFTSDHIDRMRENADALDAVICCFAALAVSEGRLASRPEYGPDGEGWIALHE